MRGARFVVGSRAALKAPGEKQMRKILAIIVASIALSVGAGATPAAAYGSDAVYQITFSFNCDDKVLCAAGPNSPFGPGGFWGWIELDSTIHPGAMTGGHADIVATGCDHDRATAPFGGADHFNLDGNWKFVGATIETGALFVTTTVPGAGPMTLVFPSNPGHYSMHPAPAIASEFTVVLIPGR